MRYPSASYRIQFTEELNFSRVSKLSGYLGKLGISDVYASPIFEARPGSNHFYDVTDPTKVSEKLGGIRAFNDMVEAFSGEGIGHIQDIVPNHMAYHYSNLWLRDLLENGELSSRYNFFDTVPLGKPRQFSAKLCAPFLGCHYSEALLSGQIRLVYDSNGLAVSYFEHRFALKASCYLKVFLRNLKKLQDKLGDRSSLFTNFLGIIYLFESADRPNLGKKSAWSHAAKMLYNLYSTEEVIREYIDECVEVFNGKPGQMQTLNPLHRMLTEQHFRLCLWRTASEEINYRRFFGLNDFICLKIERPEVFTAWHELTFKLLHSGQITGLRIDHIDGLYKPFEYLKRLRSNVGDVPIFVEKILEHDEQLPANWPIEGTTGYDFMNFVNLLFVKKENEGAFDSIYQNFTGDEVNYDQLVYESRKLAISQQLNADFENLAEQVKVMTVRGRFGQDVTRSKYKEALVELAGCFEVYRTYLTLEHKASTQAYTYLDGAFEKAKQKRHDLSYELNLITSMLKLDFSLKPTNIRKDKLEDFVLRFQQLTGPAMAKGFEDTFLYRYNRLVSLNEVGSSPDIFGYSVDAFHDVMARRFKNDPHSMNSTSTHDSKRGEDARARINVLSEIPDIWRSRCKKWSELNSGFKVRAGDKLCPDGNDEYMLYQSLVGSVPFAGAGEDEFIERAKRYFIKAIRESKRNSNWFEPDSDYERGAGEFVEKIFGVEGFGGFGEDFVEFMQVVFDAGMLNSLSQVLLKMVCPGFCDFYLGSELWNFSFVDPDNRRSVDFEKLGRYLDESIKKAREDRKSLLGDLIENRRDGRIKQFLIWSVLNARKSNADLFSFGSYVPLEAEGDMSDNVIALGREFKGKCAVAVCGRFYSELCASGKVPLGREVWGDNIIRLKEFGKKDWKEVISDVNMRFEDEMYLGDVLGSFPVAVLISN